MVMAPPSKVSFPCLLQLGPVFSSLSYTSSSSLQSPSFIPPLYTESSCLDTSITVSAFLFLCFGSRFPESRRLTLLSDTAVTVLYPICSGSPFLFTSLSHHGATPCLLKLSHSNILHTNPTSPPSPLSALGSDHPLYTESDAW